MDNECLHSHKALLMYLLDVYMDQVIDNFLGFRGNYTLGVYAFLFPRSSPGEVRPVIQLHSFQELKGGAQPS